jgi:hypothetical protein
MNGLQPRSRRHEPHDATTHDAHLCGRKGPGCGKECGVLYRYRRYQVSTAVVCTFCQVYAYTVRSARTVVSTPFSCAVTADPVSAYRISGRLAGPRETRDDRRWFIQSSIYEYRLQPTLQVVASRTRWFRTIRFKLASAPVAWSVHIHAKAAL